MPGKLLVLILLAAPAPALGWWCEGHEAAAIIASNHLGARAKAEVEMLLAKYPAGVERYCKGTPDNAMAVASTWADDVKKGEKTGAWHYMDIPLGLKKGDPETYCEPIGPSVNGRERPGCILSALRSMVNILHSEKESGEEKAQALRYLIHFMGDLHQPMHTTSNNDQGGNCTPVRFFDDAKIANLHSVWDGMMVNRDAAARKETTREFAARIDAAHAGKRAGWVKDSPAFDKWAWEGHLVAQKAAYGNLEPKPPVEVYDPKPVCEVERERFGVLGIRAGADYEAAAEPVVEEQLAKAGYRLAEILNSLWF